MRGYEEGLDVWHLTFPDWEFKLAIDGSEHAWDAGYVSALNLKFLVGRQRDGKAEFEQLPERMWFRQIDQMIAIVAEIDAAHAGHDIV